LVMDVPEKYVDLIRVIDSGKIELERKIRIQMNPLTQEGFCYLE